MPLTNIYNTEQMFLINEIHGALKFMIIKTIETSNMKNLLFRLLFMDKPGKMLQLRGH